ncbi:MAG: cyclic 2,3-diphosphoglycerate synthase [Patescibacteria group bacterium]|nr:cyclic 2,3-diphosphoglycerate synthase [Patescibacteria group bacterium]MDD5715945.1 cyclic 2,3-diphosphoglycerate synthase [Patescibacteria group bacterium]
MERIKTIIIGAAGRDFHNFNVVYRDNEAVEIIAFTAAQIPGIAGRKYPAVLAGKLYPKGIPIEDEANLEELIKEHAIDECVMSYSDLPYSTLMHIGSRVMAAGAKFSMLGADQTMIKSSKPVIAVVAVRTGCGKSQTSRAIVKMLTAAGKRVVAIRHPMPYGDLAEQAVQRFATYADLEKNKCTIEEMEEYEPYTAMNAIIYAGVDYGAILREAEKEADVILWDGGNNDMSFYKPDLTITVADPLRPGHEIGYYPGEVNFRLADVIIINKIDSAKPADIATVERNAAEHNPRAQVIKAQSTITVDDAALIKGKRVLAVEDGPTLTHGEMKIGAGIVAAQRFGARELVDPRPYLVGELKTTFEHYPNIGTLLPAMGYGEQQMHDLEATINTVDCDSVVIGTPIDLAKHLHLTKPSTRVRYELADDATKTLSAILSKKNIL